jgi:hypothetical protein
LVPAGRGRVAQRLGADAIELEPTSSRATLRARVDALLDEVTPDELIVDCFPSGILGELEPLPAIARCTLLLRLHRGAGCAAFARQASRYHRVLDLEPHLKWRPPEIGATDFGPIIAKSSSTEAQVVLVASDLAMEAYFGRLARRLQAHDIDVALGVDGWFRYRGDNRLVTPIPLRGARVVCGAAGFNLTYEAAAAGVHHLAVPRPRRYDDQFLRARQVAEVPRSPTKLEERIYAVLAGDGVRARASVRFSSRNMSQA